MLAFVLIFRVGNHQAIDDRLDGVDLIAVEGDFFFKAVNGAISAHPHKTSLANLIQYGLVGAFTPAHDRRKDQQARTFRQLFHRFNNLLRRLLADLPSADWT
ncbi:hypothetical protein FDZ74_08230, partial [bacterium]